MMNKPALATGIALLLLATAACAGPALPLQPPDKIATLVATLSKNQLWMNGIAPRVALGRDASPAQVVERSLRSISRDAGPLTQYRIVAMRDVVIPPEQKNGPPLTAVQIDSNLGPKIVLMRFEAGGWWTRVYDAR